MDITNAVHHLKHTGTLCQNGKHLADGCFVLKTYTQRLKGLTFTRLNSQDLTINFFISLFILHYYFVIRICLPLTSVVL